MEFHVLRLFLAVLHYNAGAFAQKTFLPPRITTFREDLKPVENTSHFWTNAGTSFRLLCEGQQELFWSYPPNEVSNRNVTSWKQETNPKYPFASRLHVNLPMFNDTGYYSCSYDRSKMDQEDKTTSTYIFVRDETHLLVPAKHNYYQGIQYRSVVMDCRPTFVDVNVTLWNKDDVRMDVEQQEEDDPRMKVAYDPTVGFTLSDLQASDSTHYECRAVRGSRKEIYDTQLFVLMHIDSVPKPSINGTKVKVAVGDTESLNCTVVLESFVYFSLEWTVPDPLAIAEERIKISKTGLSLRTDRNGMRKKIGTSLLTIVNASKEDNGTYRCTVVDHVNNTNFAIKDVKVIGKDERYLKLITDGPIPSVMVGEDAVWVIQVDAYPNVQHVTWWAPNVAQPLTNNVKHRIKVSETQIVLEVRDIEITDSGNYILQAMNSHETSNITLKLIVEDKPSVSLSPPAKQYYMSGVSYELNCKAVGYPSPVIQWYFSVCDNAQNCTIKKERVAEKQISSDTIINGTRYSTINWKAERSGTLFCSAMNVLGDHEEERNIWVTDVADGFHIDGKPPDDSTVEGDNITLNCGASKVNYSSVYWSFKVQNDPRSDISFPPNVAIENKTSQFSHKSILTITNITKKNVGLYTCRAPPVGEYGSDGEPEDVRITVQDMKAPKILNNDMDGSTIEVSTDDKIDWTCLSTGQPPPVITWHKDGKQLVISEKPAVYEIFQENHSLSIKYQSIRTEGTYYCQATNRAGSVRRYKTLKFKDKGPSAAIIATILVFVVISLVLVVMLGLKIKRERKLQNELKVAGLAHFEEGALDCINPELPIDDQAELLPYDRKWEFPREKLKLGKQLGAGAFGVVMKAEAHGIHDGEAITTVAVKMVKRNAEYTYIKALASELKIMVHLGKHLNVVNLLGACTKNLTKRELLVIVEYCRFGNLHNYLLRHRADFIDQVDPKTGQIDPTLGADIMARHESFNSKTRLKYAALSFSNSSGDMVVDYRAPGSNSTSGDSIEQASICMAPAGEEGCMLSNNSVQPEWRSNYQPDYKGNVRPICTRDLLCWAFQVARGMEYLAGRKVLHGDLAARNILLSDNNVVKICDFGLAKSMYKSDNYRKKGDGPLPVKWMAIESIRDRVFSTQSDVWSFGIVLWEFFSLAKTPYPGMEADEKLYMKLVEGYRMDKPEFATREIYETIDNCWLARPNDRPTFSDLAEELGSMLEDSVRMHYIDLNGPYMDMNTLWKSANQNDYLAMMSAPTYGNLIAPVEEEDEPHRYINSPGIAGATPQETGENSGYLCMKSPDLVIFSPRASNPGMFNFTPEQRRLRSIGAAGSDELKPMLSPGRSDSGSDADYRSPTSSQIVNNLNKDTNTNNFKQDAEEKTKPNITPSFSNPSYHTMSEMLNPTSDNYINMPQQKLANGSKPEIKTTDMPTSISNPNYVSMSNMEGVKDIPNHTSLANSTGTDEAGYVNLPIQDHNVSSASSGFQSDIGESPYVN